MDRDVLNFDEKIQRYEFCNVKNGRKYAVYGSMSEFLMNFPFEGRRKFTVVVDNNHFDFDLTRSEIAQVNNSVTNLNLLKNRFKNKSLLMSILNALNHYNIEECIEDLIMLRDSIVDHSYESEPYPLVVCQGSHPLNINEPRDFYFILNILINQLTNNKEFDFSVFRVLEKTPYSFEEVVSNTICNIKGFELYIYHSGYEILKNNEYSSKIIVYKDKEDNYLVIV